MILVAWIAIGIGYSQDHNNTLAQLNNIFTEFKDIFSQYLRTYSMHHFLEIPENFHNKAEKEGTVQPFWWSQLDCSCAKTSWCLCCYELFACYIFIS